MQEDPLLQVTSGGPGVDSPLPSAGLARVQEALDGGNSLIHVGHRVVDLGGHGLVWTAPVCRRIWNHRRKGMRGVPREHAVQHEPHLPAGLELELGDDQTQVEQVLHSGLSAPRPRARVGMQFLCEVLGERVDGESRGRQAGEGDVHLGWQAIERGVDDVTLTDINKKGSEGLIAVEARGDAKPLAALRGTRQRSTFRDFDDKAEVVGQIQFRCVLQHLEEVAASRRVEIEILGRTRPAAQAQFQGVAALKHPGLAHHPKQPVQEALVGQLALQAGQIHAFPRRPGTQVRSQCVAKGPR
ncbi:hypothetical protein BOO71_0003487 [Deinococcus marmoris]|uniref:Uncharacterized protein n=1 Tax=Deinococcus marmoris TaxID=249408 RepID=A0A1U7P235_9DEIO|nr:hypothetical protein BOO71_0003487 [Deinococcus marmoris]